MKDLIRSIQKKQGTAKLAGAFGLLLALTLMVGLVAMPAMAIPQLPNRFFGEVTYEPSGAYVEEGAEVSAEIYDPGLADWVEVASTLVVLVDDTAWYDFNVPADSGADGRDGGEPGDEIRFYVEGVLAGIWGDDLEEPGFENGGSDRFDLAVTIALPVVTTNDASDVTYNSATLNGSLDDLGDYTPVDVSFEWGEAEGGPYPNETTPPETMTSTGSFSAPITGLTPVTTYYFRAKATGSVTVYGDELSFTTGEAPTVPPVVTTNPASDVTTDSATLNGSLDSLGDYTPVDVSFEWGEAEGGPYPNETTPPDTMTSTGSFSAPLTGLTPTTTYYFKAKATGSITVYGDELSFITGTVVGAPVVTTAAASGITTNSATLNGSLDDLGDYSSVDVSFEWGEAEGGPYPNETTPPETMTSTGSFSAPISGLASDTTYYFKAKATGSITVYGDELSFTTEKVAPVVTTNAATDITDTSATLNGSLDSLGDYNPVDVSFEWGTTSGALDQETTPPETMTSTGSFSAPITGLTPVTTYYFRAKATGSVTVYGDELSFTTEELPPVEYTLTMAVTENGTTTPAVGDHIYLANTVVDITATADPGWRFVNWTGDVADPNSATTTVTVDADKTVTANFTERVGFITTLFAGLPATLGWNLVSTPILLDADSDTLEQIFDPESVNNIEIFYRWDALSQDWEQIFADYELLPLEAIYVKVKSDASAVAEFIPSQEISGLPSRDLVPGHNLIGPAPALEAGAFPPWPLDQALFSIKEAPGGLIGYTGVVSPAHNQPPWAYAPGGEIEDLLPYKGYWVVMDNADTLSGFSTTPP